jgi:hypothetical protein
MKRTDALVVIRVAGYHSDMRTFTRTYTENRVSYAAAWAEYQRGSAMREAGVPCSCPDCNRKEK